MLNILWVEDTDTLILEKQQTWFSGRVPDLKTNFIDAMNAIDKNLNQYDLVILDIDLENTPHTEEVSKIANYFGKTETEFLKESGVFLFLQLIEQGFDREQIIFLTGNADKNISRVDELREAAEQDDDSLFDEIFAEIQKGLNEDKRKEIASFIEEDNINGLCNSLENYYDGSHKNEEKDTYNRFCDSFKKSLVCPPKGIHKGLNVTKHLNEWLVKHEKNTYLVLRRGIIEACNYLENMTSDTELQEYFFGLKRYLPLKEPNPTEKESIYLHLVRAIVHDWDDKGRITERRNDPVKNTLGWLLKNARNWLAHDSLLKNFDEKTIAFIFLINVRMLVALDNNKLENFELKLLSIFDSTNVSEADILCNIKFFYKEAIDVCEENSVPFINRFYTQMVNDFHEKPIKSCNYTKLLFRFFMFAIYQHKSSFPKLVNTNNPNSPFLDYQVKFTRQGNLPFYLLEFEKYFYPLTLDRAYL